MAMNLFTTTQDKIRVVKSAWDKAPAGPNKDAALVHFRAAEAAHAEKNDADCLIALDAATQALA